MTLTEEQIKDMVAATEDAMNAAALAAVKQEMQAIKNDWRIKDTITKAIRDHLGEQLNVVIAEVLADKSMIEKMVRDQLTATIRGRLTRQLKTLETDDQ